MITCPKCNRSCEDNEKFCAACGADLTTAGAQAPQSNAAQPQQTNANANTNAFENIVNTADTTAEFDPADIAKNKGISVLSYFGILFLVPLLAAKDSKFARFHANQGLVLFIADIILYVVSIILGYIPFIGGILSALLSVAILVLVILGIVNAAQGKAKELPLIGSIKLIK